MKDENYVPDGVLFSELEQLVEKSEALRKADKAQKEERKRREAELKKQQDEQVAAVEKMAKDAEERAKTERKATYLEAGGKEKDFEKEWPEMYHKIVMERVEVLERQGRNTQEERLRRAF